MSRDVMMLDWGREGAPSSGLGWLACLVALFSSLQSSVCPCSEAPPWWPSDHTTDCPKQRAQWIEEYLQSVCDHWRKCSCTGVKCLEKDEYLQHLLSCQKHLFTGSEPVPILPPWDVLRMHWHCSRNEKDWFLHTMYIAVSKSMSEASRLPV